MPEVSPESFHPILAYPDVSAICVSSGRPRQPIEPAVLKRHVSAAGGRSLSDPGARAVRIRDVNPIPIHAFNPGPITGDGNWTWLIPGRVPTLIDAGTGDARHLAALGDALGGATLARVLVTHGHGDHASGAPDLARRFAGCRFMKRPWPERDAKWDVQWEAIDDGHVVQGGDVSLTVVSTPGHSPDHVCFWHAPTRTLFGGDLAIKGTTVWIPTHLQGDLAAYLTSLERVLALEPARIMPAHGAVIEEPAAVLRSYLEHRREREEQIIAALRIGESTPVGIVARVYTDLRAPLVPLAAESVTAHLLKLEREGRVTRAGQLWALTPGNRGDAEPRRTVI
jgi:glyoxylase-like metal-dependent hydrolase (beta-lactamase superfamily II)